GRVHLGHHEQVGGVEGRIEVAPERRGTAVPVRLEDAHHARPTALAGGPERGAHLAGKVRVVVDERDARTLAAKLEASGDAAVARERLGGGCERRTDTQRGDQRGGRVQRVVPAGNGEADGAELAARVDEREARSLPPGAQVHYPVVGILVLAVRDR